MEIWKDIPDYEGYYQASNLGNIKSLLFQSNLYNKKIPREKILKPKVDKDKCSRVDLWKDGKHKTYLSYRLVALTFLGKPKEGMTVNHKDGNRLNNNIDNLEWCTRKENIQHAYRTGLYKRQKKVKIENIENGGINNFRSLAEASKYIGKNKGYISGQIIKNKYANESYRWELV